MDVYNGLGEDIFPQAGYIALPLIVGILLVIVAFLSWLITDTQRKEDHHQRIEEQVVEFALDVSLDLASKQRALERMASYWENSREFSYHQFYSEAVRSVMDMPGLRIIAYLNQQTIPIWIAPEVESDTLASIISNQNRENPFHLEQARISDQSVVSSPFQLDDGTFALKLLYPITEANGFSGHLFSVLDIAKWMKFNLGVRNFLSDQQIFSIRLLFEDQVIFQEGAELEEYESQAPVSIFNRKFLLVFSPLDPSFQKYTNIVPELVIAFCFILTLLITYLVFLLQRSNKKELQALNAKKKLEIHRDESFRAQDQLKVLSNRLSLAINAGNIGVWAWTIEDDILIWNDIMYKIYDVPTDAKISFETWRNKVHPEDLEATERLLMQAIEGTETFRTEFRIVVDPGEIRALQAEAKVERDGNGKAYRITGVNWDITKRRNYEETLANNKRRLQDILEGTNVGAWEWNIRTGECIVNERWAEIIGLSLKDLDPLKMKTWRSYCFDEDLKKSNHLLTKHFCGETDTYECELRMKHKLGYLIWVLDRGKVSKWDEKGAPLLMSGTHQDITEQKKQRRKYGIWPVMILLPIYPICGWLRIVWIWQ